MGDIFVLGLILGLAIASGIFLLITINRKNPEPIGTLNLYIGDPDGVYMTLESYVIPEYIMTQKEVTLSVDVTDVSQK